MPRRLHEIRDAIHVFVRIDSDERRVVDSAAYQRLRHIHQLAMTYLVYPGATHRRFEHCLGVMEVATRIFDVVTDTRNVTNDVARELVNEEEGRLPYWRSALRMAALCHDLGHLPFSHAAEDLLPEGINHESISLALIRSDEMREHWKRMKLDAEDIAKLAVGQKKYGVPLTPWESILSEIIVGDGFGADRIDYLLRDSHHAGVAYGRFDQNRLIDTLRILPKQHESDEPMLGVEEGGLHSAEALLWARHFMYTQLYFHPVRRIYDQHLQEFLHAWLPDGKFSADVKAHLSMTDNEVLGAMANPAAPGHEPARRIGFREHYKHLYKRNPTDQKTNKGSVKAVYEAAKRQFGDDAVRIDEYPAKGRGIDFPVWTASDRVESSIMLSETLEKVPGFVVGTVYVRPELRQPARKWLEENRDTIIGAAPQFET